VIGPEQLAAGERAEAAGDFLTAAATYRSVTTVGDESVAADAYFCLGRVTWRQGRFDAALLAFESARALAARLGDTELVARVENGIGAVHYARGQYAQARRAYGSAARTTASDMMRGKIILNLGVIENIEGNFPVAREHYEEAFRLFQATGDQASALLAVHNLGMVQADLERWDAADASFLTALDLATRAGNREMIAKTLVNRCEVLVQRGSLRDAVDHCDEALRIYADVGDEVGRGEALRWRGHALGCMGELAPAERGVQEALHIAVRSGSRLLEAEAARDLGVLRGLLGDAPGSSKMLERALALFEGLSAARESAAVTALLALPAPERSLRR